MHKHIVNIFAIVCKFPALKANIFLSTKHMVIILYEIKFTTNQMKQCVQKFPHNGFEIGLVQPQERRLHPRYYTPKGF